MVRLRRSVSHVVRHGHLLTSGWVPLGPVRARRGSSGIRMGPYLSRTPIRVHRVIRQGSSGPVGSHRDISAISAKVRSGPKTSNMVRNGSRIDRLARNKDQMNRIACPDPSGPLLRPKRPKKKHFFGKRPPAAPAAPLTPIGAGRDLRNNLHRISHTRIVRFGMMVFADKSSAPA